MKKTSNVIIKALIIAIILIAVLFLAPRIYYAFFYVDDSLSSEDNDVKLLTETYPTTFYFIGDTIALNDTIKVQNITADEVGDITTATKEWAMLVINDLNDDTPIDEDQWKNIVDTVQNNTHINCMYLGNSDWDVMEKQGYFSGRSGMNDNMLSMGMIHHDGKIINTLGMFNEEDDENNLPMLLCHEQVYDLKDSSSSK